MTANQEELKKWFDQLLEEVLVWVDKVGKGRNDSGSITPGTATLIKNLIEKTTDQFNVISVKTIITYYKEGYSTSYNRIGLFAAVALVYVYKGELSLEMCRVHYAANRPSSPEYWNQYIALVKKPIIPKETPEYSPVEPQWQSQEKDVAKDPLNIFTSPEYEGVFERPSTQEKLYDKMCRHRILSVDGMAGSGKKHLVKALEPILKVRGKYNWIWWVPLHKTYTIDNFFDELPMEMDSSVKGNTAKIHWLEEQLKSNRILIVFYDIDQGELYSFLPLLQRAFDMPGDCRYLVLRDSMALFPEIPAANRFIIPTYSKEEIKSFLETDSIKPSEKDLSDISKTGICWPFFLCALKQKANDRSDFEKIVKAPDILNDDLSRWFRVWSQNLDDNTHKLLQLFFLYANPISYGDLTAIAKNIGLQQPDNQLESLKNIHFLEKDQFGLLSLTPVAKLYSRSKPENGSGIPIHEAISSFIRITLPVEPSFNFSKEELDRWHQVIEHDQQSGQFDRSGPLLEKIKTSLKRRNKYPLLIDVLSKQIQKEPKKKNWFSYDLAHAYFVTGDYQLCLAALADCFDIIIKWYAQSNGDAEGISFFVKTIQLFAELCSAAGRTKQAISIFSNALSLFEYSELNWTNRCHTITVLSQFYEREKNFGKSLEMNENLVKGNYGHSVIAKAVITMRTALAQRRLGRQKEAHVNLLHAQRLFGYCNDHRGKAWAESILALDSLADNNIPEAKKLIKQSINVHVEGSLANEDYRRWLSYLLYNTELSGLHPLIKSELERTSKTEVHSGQSWLSCLDEKIKELSKWLAPRAKFFDIDSFIKPLRGNDIPLNSELTRSLEQRTRYAPLKFLENIAAKNPTEVLSDSYTNHQIARCATNFECQEFIKRKIISKNFELLCNVKNIQDVTRMQYAGILYTMSEYQLALDLLDHVPTGSRGFDFMMLKADCLTRLRRFEQAESIYETALDAVGNNADRATTLYKRARLVIEAHDTGRFREALVWAKEAWELHNTEVDFVHFVENTIFYLTIELTQLERLELEVQKLITLYSISFSRGDSIAQSISNVTKRNKVKNILPLYAAE